MFQNRLKNFVTQNPNLVSMKPAGESLFVLKYKKRVFYDNLWNEFLEECRGTIVDQNFNIVQYPFTKIYNYGVEEKAPKLENNVPVTAYRKVNGFMVSMTWHNDEILVATTGSTQGEFVEYAKEMMLLENSWESWQAALKANRGYTMMFECVHPNDPHIIPEESGMYFLGWRENSWGSKVNGYGVSDQWREFALSVLKCKYAESFQTNVGELVKLSKSVKHEGFVFYTEDGISSKIKSPYYLTSKWVARNPRTDKLVDTKNDIKQKLDEEYYGLIDAIRENITEYSAMDEQQRLAWCRKYLSQ